ncbi:peptidoglycan DD-metalloendopeptidase family protein [Tunicatimonas pelagia]|uniref:peptidoglycan DD-metalloendopeptidase family protein n=1 Tax=Tunicatimonas pelagia TaxID=931531 RepID=UPI002666A770|nr:peptidoglycan DD-metalloendopeptidase family protein [Tunicatimonas pelagia]WKN44224.1 peptidoglycan DD-metalloendopeptidase family protein [Tunicatimonas pelagia]
MWDQPKHVPQAGLGYLLFDHNLDVLNQGWVNVSQQAQVQGEDALSQPFERLALDEIVIEQTGFIYFFVANYDKRNITVFLDDLQVTHQTTDVVYAADYYPHGEVMDGRKLEQASYRYGYQGAFAEQDDETGLASFQLRQYDSRIGRWTTPDPYNQYWSPYLGMGNAPNMMIDPDGEWSGAFSSPFIRYGAFAAGGAIAGAGVAAALGKDPKRGALIGAGVGLLVAGGLSIDWNNVDISSNTVARLTSRAMTLGNTARTIARENRLPDDPGLPTSELNELPSDRRWQNSDYILPFEDAVVSSDWGPRGFGIHNGSDIVRTDRNNTAGTPIRSVSDGTVVRLIQELDGQKAGIRVRIQDENGLQFNYFHMQGGSNDHLRLGQQVNQGDVIGRVGGSGYYDLNSFTPHLHYEIWNANNQRISPYALHPELIPLPRR